MSKEDDVHCREKKELGRVAACYSQLGGEVVVGYRRVGGLHEVLRVA